METQLMALIPAYHTCHVYSLYIGAAGLPRVVWCIAAWSPCQGIKAATDRHDAAQLIHVARRFQTRSYHSAAGSHAQSSIRNLPAVSNMKITTGASSIQKQTIDGYISYVGTHQCVVWCSCDSLWSVRMQQRVTAKLPELKLIHI